MGRRQHVQQLDIAHALGKLHIQKTGRQPRIKGQDSGHAAHVSNGAPATRLHAADRRAVLDGKNFLLHREMGPGHVQARAWAPRHARQPYAIVPFPHAPLFPSCWERGGEGGGGGGGEAPTPPLRPLDKGTQRALGADARSVRDCVDAAADGSKE